MVTIVVTGISVDVTDESPIAGPSRRITTGVSRVQDARNDGPADALEGPGNGDPIAVASADTMHRAMTWAETLNVWDVVAAMPAMVGSASAKASATPSRCARGPLPALFRAENMSMAGGYRQRGGVL